jgi:lambda family phage portal protein
MREVRIPELRPPQRSAFARAVDWVVYQFSPAAGNRRYLQREAMPTFMNFLSDKMSSSFGGGWEGANKSDPYRKFDGVTNMSPDAESEEQLEELQERCVALYKNDPMAHGAVEGRVCNEVGVGIRPQARTVEVEGMLTVEQSKKFNKDQERLYQTWSNAGCDRTGTKTFPAVQKRIVRDFANYGEAFVEFAHDPTADSQIPLVVDVISPRRVETPPWLLGGDRVRLGVQYDEKGRIEGYWVRKFEEGDTLALSEEKESFRFVPIRDRSGYVRFCHVFEAIFDGQSRGYPWLAASINRFADQKDFAEASIISAQVEACFAAFIKVASGSPYDEATAAAIETTSDGQRLERLTPGTIERLGQDEEIQLANPSRPAGTFAPFMEWVGRSLAACINYPYELLHKNFFRTTYSSGRLAMLDGRLGFLARRGTVVDECLQHLWRLLVWYGVAGGHHSETVELADFLDPVKREEFMQHAWLGTGWQSIDPEREVKAHATGVESKLETLSDGLGERGVDTEEHLAKYEAEQIRLIEMDVALRLKRKELEEAAGLVSEEEERENAIQDEPEPEPVGAGSE